MVFRREIDWARFRPWLLRFALFLLLLVLALLTLILVHLSPAANFLQPLMSDTLILLLVFLARLPIRRTKFDSSARRSGHVDAPFCLLISVHAHARALQSGMNGLASLFPT